MFKHLVVLLALVVSGCSYGGGYSSNREMISDTKKGIVVIMTEKGENSGLGTGFFIGENLIVTNHHVIDDSDNIEVGLETNNETYKAKVLFSDKVSDLALVEIVDYEKFEEENEGNYKNLEFANDYEEGDTVFAIGHPQGQFYSATKGSISFIGRKVDPSPRFMVQTDAQILQGNSGGPLVTEDGKVVAVNDMIMPVTGGTLSYSIDSEIVKKVLEDWKNYGEVRWPALGINLEGTKVGGVMPGSAAELAGIKTGDQIISLIVDGNEVKTLRSYDITNTMGKADYESTFKIIVKDPEGDILDLDITPQYKTSKDFEAAMKDFLNKRE